MSETRVLNDEISGRIAWRGEDLAPDDGHNFHAGCLAELDALVREISQNPLPLPALRPDDFELPESQALMQQAREVLEEGVGFVLIDLAHGPVVARASQSRILASLLHG